MVAYHKVILDAIKFSFEFPNLRTISVHLFVGARPIFIDLVNDQGRITEYQKVLDVELGGDVKTVETCFVFGGVVGGQKMYSEDVSEIILGWRNK